MDPVTQAIADRISGLADDRPRRVAIDGITAAGKTTFADRLATALRARGNDAIRLSMDGYHHPRAVRYRQGRSSADGYYEDAYDLERFRQFVLDPLGSGGDRRYRPAVLDLAADRPIHAPPIEAPPAAVLVVDGSFLQKPVLRDAWDLVVYLRARFEAAEARGARRDADLLGGLDAAREAFRNRYHAAQRRYLAECDPEAAAGVVVRVDDPTPPPLIRPPRPLAPRTLGGVRFSVVVPAHNEEALLGNGLAAIAAAADRVPDDVEVVVVANRCTDGTERIAREAGAVVVPSEARNLSAVRNAGVAAATGEAIVTIDADCLISPYALEDVGRLLATGRYVGGGTKVRPERLSPGIWATITLVDLITVVTRLSGGSFWCWKADFDAIGGFDESLLVAEDVDFARRLRAHGRRTGRRLTMLRSAPMVSSCRKFDRFGDWHMFRMAFELRDIRAAMKGTDTRWVDRYFFDFNDDLPNGPGAPRT